ncbi:MAG TPA: AMP-binding protein [Acidimicrobiales bacterium]|jgi:malonyl-CoA/methylmalonyl-CoA synthetase|nr:AMP-binding protein [Acidimicrobiales bacterium]
MRSPLLELFVPHWEDHPDAPFLVRDRAVAHTLGDLASRVRGLAGALHDRGVRPGDRVSVQVERHPDSVVLYLAVLWAGAVFHPMNPAYLPEEADYLLSDAEPALAVRSLAELGELVAAADAGPGRAMAEPVDRDADDLAALLYTSGTTGRPKGAMISHGNLASNAVALRRAWGFEPDDAVLHVLPVFHAHGLFVACNTSLANGTPLVWHDGFDVDAVIDSLAGLDASPVRPTVFMGVPTHYTRLLGSPRLDRTAVGDVRLFVSGSAPLQATTHGAFEERTGQRVLERYGMTETLMIASNPLDGPRIGGTVGYALPGVEVRVVDDSGATLPARAAGDVQVRGPNVCLGYWRQPERRAVDTTPDGWFRTGDLGVLADDGRLTLVGRSKDLIISGGYNVYPAELERLLDELPGVAESAVVGMPHPEFGESGVAVLVADPAGPVGSPDPDACLQELARHVARYKVPRWAVVVSDLPRNAMGKVQKAQLRQDLAAGWSRFLQQVQDAAD